MEKIINYRDLSMLTAIKHTIEKLDKYLYHLKFTIETKFENFEIQKNLNVKDEEFVLVQKIENLTIKVGFFWGIGDVFYGVEIDMPREEGKKLIALKESLSNKKWGFSRRDTSIIFSKYNRLIEDAYSFEEDEKEHEMIFTSFVTAIEEAKCYVDKILLIQN